MFKLLLITLFASLQLIPTLGTAAEASADIIVYGGTASGIAAVCEAASHGHSVILVVPEKFIGGMTTGGLGASDKGESEEAGQRHLGRQRGG